jgi:hypothetical protein
MAVNPISGMVAKYGGVVSTLNISTGTLQVILKTADNPSVSVYVTGPIWRWPQVGDSVMIRQENGSWYFDGWFISTSTAAITLNDINPGDVAITTPTGVVRVIGSVDGSTDFTMTKPGSATLVSGSATVSNPVVNAASRIMLTAQDNNTTGALRISSRVANTSFTITSSNNGDHGVVGYQIFNS